MQNGLCQHDIVILLDIIDALTYKQYFNVVVGLGGANCVASYNVG